MKKDGFYIQLHLHTSETSRCGIDDGAAMARACAEAGYDLIVITDHFFNANIRCDAGLSWKQKVDFLFRGYRAARAEGEKLGLTVLKGWETYNDGPEYLTYGLDERFLLENPDIARVSGPEYLRRIREAGGFVAHAHPYRKAYYIPPFTPSPRGLEAFEVFNGVQDNPASSHYNLSYNAQALEAARRHGVIEIAGSDAHRVSEVRGGAMRLPHPVHTMPELIAALRAREAEVVEWMD